MTRLLIAFATTAVLATGAFAQSTTTTNPVPGTSAGETSLMPADAASAVVVPSDAPPASTAAATSKVPVPGNGSGVASTMPADAASTVVVTKDATAVPKSSPSPVPGSSAGEDSVQKPK